MIKLSKPTVGPLLGYREYDMDSASQRVLVRGRERSNQTCHLLVREIGGSFEKKYTRKISDSEHRDHTTVINLTGLPLDSRFEYKTTIARGDVVVPNFDDLKAKDCYRGTFETRNSNDSVTTFVFGSCCHLSLIGINQADDAAFKTIRNQWQDRRIQDDFIMMLGDQIYGDHRVGKGPWKHIPVYRAALLALKIKNKKKLTFKHYLSHYKKAFEKRDKKDVMSSLPTYMTFDDHEVHNDWGSKEFLNERVDYEVLKNALKAYNIYQVSHPGIVPPAISRIRFGSPLPEARYYYEFSHGKCDFFVMDTRYEKETRDELVKMISGTQMSALKSFLNRGSDRIKFVASSVPMFPDANLKWLNQIFDTSPNDRWEGHIVERMEILEHIRKNIRQNINPNIIFLSGDVHCSFAYSLSHSTDKKFKIHQITSSAFNWGVGLNDMHFGKRAALRGSEAKYRPKNLTGNVITKDNFCRVTVKTKKIVVRFFSAKTGKELRHVDIALV